MHKILIVDDTAANIEVLLGILHDNYKVSIARDGHRALQLLAGNSLPDIILLDIMMPGISGFSVCQQIKSQPRLAEIPIIFISACTATTDIVNGLQLGAVDYITKPFQPEEVLVRVKTQLAIFDQQRELKTLLSQTLTGSVQLLTELIALSNQTLVKQSNRIKRYLPTAAKMLPLNSAEFWKLELSAMLVNIGYIALPAVLKIKLNSNTALNQQEQDVLKTFSLKGADMIERIPRLSAVADIIRTCFSDPKLWPTQSNENSMWAAATLYALFHYVQLLNQGIEPIYAYRSVAAKIPRGYSLLADFLENCAMSDTSLRKVEIPLALVKPGMIIGENLIDNQTGITLIPQFTAITDNLLKIISLYNESTVPTGNYITVYAH